MLNTAKYENAILYFAEHQSDKTIHGRKKLAKLLYYADFDRFEYKQSMRTITGDTYENYPMGPVPNAYREVADSMAERGLLTITTKSEYAGKNATTLYRARVAPDLTVFDTDDRNILERVCTKYAGLNGTQLEILTHREAPWAGTALRETIPFEMAFYRGTNFNE